MFQWTNNYYHTAPSGASGVSITPSGLAWANSAWAEVHPGTDYDWVLGSVIVQAGIIINSFEVDIGVVPVSGSISACTTIATVKGQWRGVVGNSDGVMPIPIPIDAIPANHRVGARLRKLLTSTLAWSVAIQFYKKPINGNVQVTAKPLKVIPAAADGVTLNASSTAWNWGTWVTLTASAAADLTLAAIGFSHAYATDTDFEIQIGVGPAASEVPIYTYKGNQPGTTAIPGYVPLWNPVEGITSGSRVAARYRKEGTNTTGPVVHICYYEEPL